MIITVKAKLASTSAQGPSAFFSVLGSNDAYCDTASTTTGTLNPVLVKDINWFDVGDHLKGKVHATALPTSTTTIPWTSPSVQSGREIILTDVGYDCLALQVSASGTVLWVQAITKESN